jgi:psp operon transcriptional activator
MPRHERIKDSPAPRIREALGNSDAFLAFQERLSRVAPVDRPVLLVGERGTGKELAASRLHYLSRRWQGPMIALNCSALSPSLIESELFGFEKGAFTGADRRRTGRFEAAHGGTLFLDEIGNIPMEVQEKILRVVEYGAFERVGSSEEIEVDVRIVAATNADLVSMVEQGRFKPDLLDRLSFDVLTLPPLREREGDIRLLADHFAARMAFEIGREETPEFTDDALRALESHAWPGNVRELKNVAERAVYQSDSRAIDRIIFDPFRGTRAAVPPRANKTGADEDTRSAAGDLMGMPLKDAIRELKRRHLKRALKRSKYNQRKAADLLGLTYDQFRGMYRALRDKMD